MKVKILMIFSGVFFALYLSCFHYTSQYELGIMINKIDNTIKTDTPGINFSPPWILVTKVDKRPQKVCITSSSRTMTCKLAQFVPNAYNELIEREGFHYYWLNNRISFNSGYNEEYRGFRDIMRGYAFSGTHQAFLKITDEIHE